MEKARKILLLKIIIELIIFSFISLIVFFTWWFTAFLSFVPFAIIWTFWWFNVFEFITSLKIESKYRIIWSIMNGLFILFIVIGITLYYMAFDTVDNTIDVKYFILFIVDIVLLLISFVIFVINIIHIVKKYYRLLIDIIKNKINGWKNSEVRQTST
jgi:hypothetical protein